jgi:c-di-GMP-binding flagellar brake protein YcgR
MDKTANREQTIVGPLKIWDKLELVFEEDGKQGRYRTRVEDVEGNSLVIDRPSLLTGDTLFRVGAAFVAWFIKSDSAYTFSGRVLKRVEGDLDVYWISKPTSVDRNQRRRFYRITDDSPVTVILADHLIKKQDPETEVKVFEGIALDISGNGMHLRSKLDTSVGTKVLLTPRFRELKRDFFLIGVIRRKVSDGDNWHGYGIEFFTIEEVRQLFSSFPAHVLPKQYLTFNENQRSLLLNYIFAKQLALKKKGLI